MPVPDARTRSKISLNPKVLSASVPTKLLPRILLSNGLFATALHLSKDWIFAYDAGVLSTVMRVLACAGVGVMVWEATTGQLAKRKNIEWSALGVASVLLFVQQACLFTALSRLSSVRVVLFTEFSALWVDSVLSTQFSRKTLAIAFAFLLSLLSDANLSMDKALPLLPGYVALVLHGLSSAAWDHTLGVVSPSLGTSFTLGASILGACIFALPFYLFQSFMMAPATPAILSLSSLAAIPLLSFSLLWLHPTTAKSLSQYSPVPYQHFILSFPFTFVFASIFGPLAFSQTPCWTDLFVASFLYVGMYPDYKRTSIAIAQRTPTSRLIRSYLKTILSNAESRKIFYFLMLNMAYMLVQMLYGVWTNSLGLISDAIHMAFDCMAIGVGLFASVMATWEPNERFTYGYGRIETLSGFANGIFLILISIFIVFEAIQRILEPPEMNTSQLLLVSSLGLAVNLFGMFAMGGHHHHGGHSHGHSHDHGHSHAYHTPAASAKEVNSHSQAHSHSHSQDSACANEHGHSHSHAQENHVHAPQPLLAAQSQHSHSSKHSHSHSVSPTTSPFDSHSGHSHSSDAHSHTNGPHSNGHSHSQSHTPSPPPNGHAHTHEQVIDLTSPTPPKKSKRQFQGAGLRIEPPVVLSAVGTHVRPTGDELQSPITPSYKFVNDVHLQTHSPAPTHNAHAHEGHSHNMRGVFLHVMADTLGSVGVIVSTLLIQFYGWTGFDPIASLFIAILIAASVVPLVVDTGKVLCLDLDGRETKIEAALSELSSIEGLASYSQARFWPKDATTLIGSIHVQLSASSSAVDPGGPHAMAGLTYARMDRVVERVDSLLRERITGLEELTIQTEEAKVYFKTSVSVH